jgi:hypothetical protein
MWAFILQCYNLHTARALTGPPQWLLFFLCGAPPSRGPDRFLLSDIYAMLLDNETSEDHWQAVDFLRTSSPDSELVPLM